MGTTILALVLDSTEVTFPMNIRTIFLLVLICSDRAAVAAQAAQMVQVGTVVAAIQAAEAAVVVRLLVLQGLVDQAVLALCTLVIQQIM